MSKLSGGIQEPKSLHRADCRPPLGLAGLPLVLLPLPLPDTVEPLHLPDDELQSGTVSRLDRGTGQHGRGDGGG